MQAERGKGHERPTETDDSARASSKQHAAPRAEPKASLPRVDSKTRIRMEESQRALRAVAAEGLELRRDPTQPNGYHGVSSFGFAGAVRYRAALTVVCDARGKRRMRVLGTFNCAEAAALCIARAERDVSALRF